MLKESLQGLVVDGLAGSAARVGCVGESLRLGEGRWERRGRDYEGKDCNEGSRAATLELEASVGAM